MDTSNFARPEGAAPEVNGHPMEDIRDWTASALIALRHNNLDSVEALLHKLLERANNELNKETA